MKKRLQMKFTKFLANNGGGGFGFRNGYWWRISGRNWSSIGNKNARKIVKRYDFCQKKINALIQTFAHTKID